MRMNKNRDFHATEALAIATDEVIPLGLIQRDEVFAFTPIPSGSFCGAVVITSFVHLKHIVLVLLVPKCYLKKKGVKSQKNLKRQKEVTA